MTQTSEYEHIVTNGVAAPHPPPLGVGSAVGTGLPPGPRLPKRLAWLDLPQEYPDFKVRVWVNFPRRFIQELTSGDQVRLKAVLMQIVVEHNEWCSPDGEPLPPATSEAFWDEIPDELAGAMISLVFLEVGKLASSVRTKSGS